MLRKHHNIITIRIRMKSIHGMIINGKYGEETTFSLKRSPSLSIFVLLLLVCFSTPFSLDLSKAFRRSAIPNINYIYICTYYMCTNAKTALALSLPHWQNMHYENLINFLVVRLFICKTSSVRLTCNLH